MHLHPRQPSSRPFLKWAGGKQRLLSTILPHLPRGSRLVEPFVGAGSVFLATEFGSNLLNDANPDLIAVWVALKERPREFVRAVESIFVPVNHSQEAYLRIRTEFNACEDRFQRAVRFVYLNRFGFNGLWRVNGKGMLNVPYGSPKSMPRLPADELEAAARKLELATILSGGFEGAMDQAGPGDVVYCDPPYCPSEAGESFTKYTEGDFGQREHRSLVEAAVRAAAKGATVVVSNHDTPATRSLYSGWEITSFNVRRSVAAAGQHRGDVRELLAKLLPYEPLQRASAFSRMHSA